MATPTGASTVVRVLIQWVIATALSLLPESNIASSMKGCSSQNAMMKNPMISQPAGFAHRPGISVAFAWLGDD